MSGIASSPNSWNTVGPSTVYPWVPRLMPFYRGKFDVWAWRGLAGIQNDEDLRLYDKWLVSFAQNWLDDRGIESSNDPEEHKRPLIAELHKKLLEGIAHWQSEARQFLRSHEEGPRDLV